MHLKDGRYVVVYNHTPRGRTPLNLAISRDGDHWTPWLTLESDPGEYSYPAMIQAADGMLHITYTWRRQKIKHVEIKLADHQGGHQVAQRPVPAARRAERAFERPARECD